MESLAGDLGFDTDIKFTRLAVTPEQVRSLRLPIPPAKPTDQRPFSGQTVRCEAIPPDELARIIRTAIEERLDQSAYGGVLAGEEVARLRLQEWLRPLLNGWSPAP